MTRGLFPRRTVKVHLMDAKITFPEFAILGKSKLDRDSATTLLIDNIDTIR